MINQIPINSELFQSTITNLACEDGVEFLLTLPGVWETVSEYYNNDAIKHIEELWQEYQDGLEN